MSNDYAYIVGRVRALETQLLSQTLLERILDAKNAHEAFQVLNDHQLMADYMDDFTVSDYHKVFSAALKNVQRVIHEMAPEKHVMNFLWYKYDFHNLKVILKAKLTNHGYADVQHALVDASSYSLSDWESVLFGGKSFDLIPGVGSAIKMAEELYEKSKDPQIIDIVVDQHYLLELFKIAEEIENPLTLNYIKRLIDFSNAKSFIRSRERKKDRFYFEKTLLKGGFIYPETFISAYDKGYDELRLILEGNPHMTGLSDVLEGVKKERSIFPLETRMLESLQNFMKESRRISFGPEPVFAFFFQFENQLQILRTIFIGKLNNLETKEIMASLPVL